MDTDLEIKTTNTDFQRLVLINIKETELTQRW